MLNVKDILMYKIKILTNEWELKKTTGAASRAQASPHFLLIKPIRP